jgi:hypothetical protein
MLWCSFPVNALAGRPCWEPAKVKVTTLAGRAYYACARHAVAVMASVITGS